MKDKRIWITWENQRRNRELSTAFNARLFEFKEIDEIKNPVKKYTLGLLKTIQPLIRERPPLVFCQNPSLVLSAFLVTLRKFTQLKVIVDAHNAGLFPKEGKSYLLGLLSRYIQRHADINLVTNQSLLDHVEQNGGRGFILQDRIPAIPEMPPRKLGEGFNLLFICSYGEDEPYESVFEAAQAVGAGIQIHVTGNYRKKNIDPASVPGNVRLLGYVSEEEYVTLLNSVDATIDLTTREDCLLCGAYETVAVEKAQILSGTKALRSYFRAGAVYTDNTASSLVDCIKELIEEKDRLEQETRALKPVLQQEWEARRMALEEQIVGLLKQGNRS
ncbi:MAG TPA: hypothetical protein PKV86_13035 [Syntrophobacteraceae bacterium]|nr:hypothetical protein [Syntrophobacteraceae bacterium]